MKFSFSLLWVQLGSFKRSDWHSGALKWPLKLYKWPGNEITLDMFQAWRMGHTPRRQARTSVLLGCPRGFFTGAATLLASMPVGAFALGSMTISPSSGTRLLYYYCYQDGVNVDVTSPFNALQCIFYYDPIYKDP